MAVIRGSRRWERRLHRLARGGDYTDLLLKGAERTRTRYVEMINNVQGSTIATRYDPYRQVVVSDPGSPPNADIGDLVAGTGVEVAGKNRAIAYSEAQHATPLEFGTLKMAARPALRPAFKETKEQVMADIKARVKEETDG